MKQILLKTADWIKGQNRRIVIGISGHGASGKTTFAGKLLALLGENDVNYINTDPYIVDSGVRKHAEIDYEYEGEKHHFKMTACHPAAHNALALKRDIRMIRDGLDLYTIGTHYMESTLVSSSKNATIIEGMTTAFVDRDLFDLKIYLYTDGETEIKRRGIRDVDERGADLEYLLHSHNERRIQYEVFMHPYHQNFDVVIRNSNGDFEIERCDFPS
ncbi:uridine kinase family protein [Falsibacillus pallidus]|uniref:uridine kinase family protein n=1 Tax=Falsibacillus pallidus TaxID=493781 RepID=UPI003D95EAEB